MATLKVSITMTSSVDKRTTKTFDKLLSTSADSNLVDLAKKYSALTNAVATTAKKQTTDELNLS